jgi:hypothetical protein
MLTRSVNYTDLPRRKHQLGPVSYAASNTDDRGAALRDNATAAGATGPGIPQVVIAIPRWAHFGADSQTWTTVMRAQTSTPAA